MELSVLIEQTSGNGFRASSGEPLPATAEGATRDEALANLRSTLAGRLANGAEVVRIHLPELAARPPVWPDTPFIADWLEGIAEARRAADSRPDPWDIS